MILECMQPQPAVVGRPQSSEHDPYYSRYIDLVPDGDIVSMLDAQRAETVGLLAGVSEDRANSSYAPGKWTVKEVLGHISDTERIFAYRALRFARNDQTPIEGFDQDPYVISGSFNRLPLSMLVEEFRAVRQATLALFRSFDQDVWTRQGPANGKAITVRALAYTTAGHELHHRAILRDRYLGA